VKTQPDPKERLRGLGSEVRLAFARNQRVMSFDEYYALLCREPVREARSSAQYLRDAFDHFGTERVRHPTGTITRYKLFDCPFDEGRGRLIGHEDAQGRFYRTLGGFVREGKVNRLILLHGPNGSAKSTFVDCLARALEHYSLLDEGALYRFHWVFPGDKLRRAGIGFSGSRGDGAAAESYATLGDDLVDARLRCELRDPPVLLLPPARRREILEELLAGAGAKEFVLPEYVLRGEPCHKCKQIYEALLTSYQGDWAAVMRHVQVERFYLSRRYREGIVTVEPQLSVDARVRQVTSDRSLGALPPALQSLNLFEAGGDLCDANRGLIEYADLLKRPIEAFKYLLGMVEQGRVSLETCMLHLDAVMVGSSNEGHLAMFKEMPEFASFKGRLELVRMPYLCDHTVEHRIYEEQVTRGVLGKHVAPHVAEAAALWAVLTRMRKPVGDKYPKGLAELVGRLGPLDKANLYAGGEAPQGFTSEQAADLKAAAGRIFSESDAYPNYEGRSGASPREIKSLLLNAAENQHYTCLSVPAVLEELEELCKNVTVYEFLKQEPLPGGYHENRKFIATVQERYLDLVEDEARTCMGLVEEAQYLSLFSRYVLHVSQWVKKEKVRNPITGDYEDPDEDLLGEVERTLGVGPKKADFRNEIIAAIGGWGIEHPAQKPDYARVFPRHLARLREAYFEQQRRTVRKVAEELLVLLTDGPAGLEREARARAEKTLGGMKQRFGYCESCAREALSLLYKSRLAA
jgi:serine protein kinase